MHTASAASIKDLKMMRNRRKKKDIYKLEDLRAQIEDIKAEIRADAQKEQERMEQEMIDGLVSGKLKLRDLIHGVDINELMRDYERHGNIRQSAKKYGIAALTTIAQSLDSDDERNRLVAAKIIVDAAAPTKEEIEQINNMKVVDALPLRDQEILARYTNQPKERITKNEL